MDNKLSNDNDNSFISSTQDSNSQLSSHIKKEEGQGDVKEMTTNQEAKSIKSQIPDQSGADGSAPPPTLTSPVSSPSDEARDLMSCSYTEISPQLSEDEDYACDQKTEGGQADGPLSPDLVRDGCMSLPQLSSTIVNWSQSAQAQYDDQLDIGPRSTTSTGSHVVSYVAEDLEQILRMSRDGSMTFTLLGQIERHAQNLELSLNRMLNHLQSSTNKMTTLTLENMKAYQTSLDRTCQIVDSNIKLMYQLMAKTEELNNSMSGVPKLAQNLKEIRRLLDLFERAVDRK